jgi:Tfp pilus assembly protein FimT
MDLAVVLLVAIAVLAVGLRVGMLAAPRLTRWAEREEEEPHE